MGLLSAILVGCLVGLLTGLVPALHVNTIAAVALATLPLDAPVALGLVAVATVHTIVTILPAAYLGVPGEDTALALLPAHRLVQEGRGPECIRVSVQASLAAIVLAVLLVVPYRWLLGEPGRALPLLEAATPWLLAGVLVWFIAQDRPAALLVMGLAGALGVVARDLPMHGLVPTSHLLPLLTGLFAVPTLLAGRGAGVPPQHPTRSGPQRGAVVRGTLAAMLTAVLPGLTAAVATAIAQPGRQARPTRVVAILSAVNSAHLVLGLGVLWITGRSRSGIAQTVRTPLDATVWTTGAWPPGLHAVLATVLAAGLIGAAGTLLLEPWARRVATHPGIRHLELGALSFLTGLVLTLTGAWGLALFLVAAVVGNVPLALGVRRVHLAAALIIPILWPG